MSKLLHISLNGPYTSGFTYQDNLLPKYHARLGFDVTILVPNWQFGKDGELEMAAVGDSFDGNVHVVRIGTKSSKGITDKFKTYPTLFDELNKADPDIIFVHGCQFRDTRIIIEYVKNCKEKPVLYVDNHADYSNSATNPVSKYLLHRVIWRHYARLLEPCTSRFWGVMPSRVDFLVENYGLPKEKCSLLVMGGDDDEIYRSSDASKVADTKSGLGFKDDDFIVVTGGKIDEAKRQVLALMDAVSAMGEHVKLLIFGPVVPSLKDEFEKRLDCDRIVYVPWANTAGSYDYFAIADLVVFPGRHSVYWEQAAAMGKPLLIKYWKGTTHVDHGGNVAYTSGDDAASIRADIASCSDPATISRMRKAASEASKEFLYSAIARRSIGCGEEAARWNI